MAATSCLDFEGKDFSHALYTGSEGVWAFWAGWLSCFFLAQLLAKDDFDGLGFKETGIGMGWTGHVGWSRNWGVPFEATSCHTMHPYIVFGSIGKKKCFSLFGHLFPILAVVPAESKTPHFMKRSQARPVWLSRSGDTSPHLTWIEKLTLDSCLLPFVSYRYVKKKKKKKKRSTGMWEDVRYAILCYAGQVVCMYVCPQQQWDWFVFLFLLVPNHSVPTTPGSRSFVRPRWGTRCLPGLKEDSRTLGS